MKQEAPANAEIGYAFPPLSLCCLPSRRPPAQSREWIRSAQTIRVQITAASADTLPHGQDRLIPILLSTAAIHQNQRTIRLGSAYSMLRKLGLEASGRNYARLADRFRRIRGMTIRVQSLIEPQVERSYPLVESTHLWFESEAGGSAAIENAVTVSEGFWTDLRKHPVPVEMDVIRKLLPSPGCLDLYLWLALRAGRVRQGRFIRVPLFGASGLVDQLGSPEYGQPRDFRRKIRHWLSQTRNAWPVCPALLSSNGNDLLVWHRRAVHSDEAEVFLRNHVHYVSPSKA
jgi:hypothetical protein